MKRRALPTLLLAALLLTGCAPSRTAAAPEEGEKRAVSSPGQADDAALSVGESTEKRETAEAEAGKETEMRLRIGDAEVPVVWEENASVEALRKLAVGDGVTISMSMYGGFEQVGPLGTSLPDDDSRISASAGDVVLYAGDRIVLFYGSNTWAYTRLGRIELPEEEIAALLSGGNVTVWIRCE